MLGESRHVSLLLIVFLSKIRNLIVFVSTSGEKRCGRPVFPNGEVSSKNYDFKSSATIKIHCNEGYHADVDILICLNGKWDLNTSSLQNVCARESSLVSSNVNYKKRM